MFCFVCSFRLERTARNEMYHNFFSELFNRNSKKKKRSEMKIRRVPIENSLHKNVKLCNKFAEMVYCLCAYVCECEFHKMNMFRLTIFIDAGTPFNHTYSLYLFAFFPHSLSMKFDHIFFYHIAHSFIQRQRI